MQYLIIQIIKLVFQQLLLGSLNVKNVLNLVKLFSPHRYLDNVKILLIFAILIMDSFFKNQKSYSIMVNVNYLVTVLNLIILTIQGDFLY